MPSRIIFSSLTDLQISLEQGAVSKFYWIASCVYHLIHNPVRSFFWARGYKAPKHLASFQLASKRDSVHLVNIRSCTLTVINVLSMLV